MNEEMIMIKRAVSAQANDEGLWFVATTATEDYLQAALRDLHKVIEDKDYHALRRIEEANQ